MSDDTSVPTIGSAEQYIMRTPAVFHELTPEFKWEFTRRHPYYLMYWRFARSEFQPRTEQEETVKRVAPFLLQRINVYGEPVDPATSFDQLTEGGQEFLTGWKLGAASPITLKSYLTVLAYHLSPEGLQVAADLLRQLASSSQPREMAVAQAMTALGHADFEQLPAGVPILSFNLHAPASSTNDAVKAFLDNWRENAGIDGGRRHLDKRSTYLEVWDRREGWKDNHYQAGAEQTIKEIERDMRASRSTISNQYKAAYRFIVGHDYQRETWLRLFLYPKARELLRLTPCLQARYIANLSARRQSARTIAETTFTSGAREPSSSLVSDSRAVSDDTALRDLHMDLQNLKVKGLTVAEIAEKMEIPAAEVVETLEWLERADGDRA